MRRSELVRFLSQIPAPAHPSAAREQVMTPPELAADLLLAAVARDDLEARAVLDLGAGTGILAMGAARLGAASVVGVEMDREALDAARRTGDALAVRVEWVEGDVSTYSVPADTVVMNPPFGAQTRHADRPFWDAAFTLARRRIYAFALADSRSFIEKRAVARGARIEETRPVRWPLPRLFRHHRKARVELPVDLWVLGPAQGR
jgi:putative methylase